MTTQIAFMDQRASAARRVDNKSSRGVASHTRPTDIQRRVNRLKAFKDWLNSREIRANFTTVEDLRGKISFDLLKWCERHGRQEVLHLRKQDPSKYLRLLRQETSHINIRGLQVESGKAHRFPIDDLYIPLTMTPVGETDVHHSDSKDKGSSEVEAHEKSSVEFHSSLKRRRLVILGDPGSGKSTFLRHIVYRLCNARLGIKPETSARNVGLEDEPLPLLIRISELAEHVSGCLGQAGAPTTKSSPAWLAHFLGARNEEGGIGVDQAYFQRVLTEGPAQVLLDGLDETPTRAERECIADLVTEAAKCFEKCLFVVTTRPRAFVGGAILPDFAQVRIDPLNDGAIEGFLRQWCRALFGASERQADQHHAELLEALRSRLEIRRMARNPVMLTALAVVHWHEKRLPEQRADLYESIITWLSRARERRAGRLAAETCVKRLWELALAMQDHRKGRQVQVSRRWAAERLEKVWPKDREASQQQRIERVEQFLREEELDSGIVVARGDDIRFWHLTFQEFLAARAIAARSERNQRKILLTAKSLKVFQSNWREVVMLLAGVLFKQGAPKADGLVSSILDQVKPNAALVDQARTVALLGAIMSDLRAVGYEPADTRYRDLLDRVMAIFDGQGRRGMNIKKIIETADALGQAGDPRFVHSALVENWVDIPAGEFLMGAQAKEPSQANHDSEAYEDESPVHRVQLEAYRMGRYPVTVGEYSMFIDAGGYSNEACWNHGHFGEWKEPADWDTQLGHLNRPVVRVNWFEASAYAAWKGGRLPTEAEWERAACGAEGRRYPWGDANPDGSLLNYDGNAGFPTPVGIYPRGASIEGILDMAGNVGEWCSDWYAKKYYKNSPKENPTGPSSGSSRVLRGGSWSNNRWNCRSSYRYYCFGPAERYDYFGFRLVS